jgi:aldose 1-epimerase
MLMFSSHPAGLLPEEKFKKNLEGRRTGLFFLKGENGFTVAVTNYGARIVAIYAAAKNGGLHDVVLGFDSIDNYLNTGEIYHGAIVGRYANRIAKGKFSIDNKTYTLPVNNGPNHLHGGLKGFESVIWEVIVCDSEKISLQYISPDGEQGYPGNLTSTVTYSIKDTSLVIDFEAVTDQPTVVNLTNHAYFNLNGQGEGSVHDHDLMINAEYFTPVDNTLIPTGELRPVEGTPFDFRKFHKIGERVDGEDVQLKTGGGYDHNFVLKTKESDELILAAKAKGDLTGIELEVWTTEPGVQLYTGNFMKGTNTLKYGKKDTIRSGFCLETQHFPDSPNHPEFPSTLLKPGDTYRSSTIFKFG